MYIICKYSLVRVTGNASCNVHKLLVCFILYIMILQFAIWNYLLTYYLLYIYTYVYIGVYGYLIMYASDQPVRYQDSPRLVYGSKGSGPGKLWYPEGVAVDPDTGDIHVADSINDRVNIYSDTGTYIKPYGSETSDDRGLPYPSWCYHRQTRTQNSDWWDTRRQYLHQGREAEEEVREGRRREGRV